MMTINSRNAAISTRKKILVVDDDPRLRDLLRRYLTEQGFMVEVAQDGADMQQTRLRETFDMIVLDVMMPGDDGLTLCRKLRAAKDDTPVIMLTAKAEDVDRILGLELGADDYVSKPFNPRELLARINAVLRRRQSTEHPAGPSHESEVVSFGPYRLNLAKRSLTNAGQDVPITSGEFALLKVLVRHPKTPLSRDRLMEMARGREYEAFDRSLDVQISRLRKLIEPNPSKPTYIQTVWGLGYVFVPDGEA